MDIRKFVLSYYGNATESFHINEIRQPKGALQLHIHDYFQIYYLKSGRIVHHLASSSAPLSPGDVFVIPPDLPHYIETASEDLLLYSISFTEDFLSGIRDSNKLVSDFIHYLTELSLENIPPSFSMDTDGVMITDALIGQIMKEFSSGRTGEASIIGAAMGLLLSVFARAYLEEKCESIKIRSDREAMRYCVSYLENHLCERLTLGEMAKRTAMSKTAFCSAFSREVGESFSRYLNRKRIEKAAALIKDGERVTVAAELSGYSDFSTFYRNFKKHFGVSPTEYVGQAAHAAERASK